MDVVEKLRQAKTDRHNKLSDEIKIISTSIKINIIRRNILSKFKNKIIAFFCRIWK